MENQVGNHNGNGGKFRNYLYNEVALFFGFAGVVLSAFIWITNPQQDQRIELEQLKAKIEASETIASKLQNIKDNDLHTIEGKINDIQETQSQILQELAGLKAIINLKK